MKRNLFLIIILSSCISCIHSSNRNYSIQTTHIESQQKDRQLASQKISKKAHGETIEIPKIYEYEGLLKAPPLQDLLTVVVRKGLKIYLKRLPLENSVRERIYRNLESERLAQYFVPFVLASKNLFLASKKVRKDNFNQYILGAYPSAKMIPGLEHELFKYPKKEFIADVDLLYDSNDTYETDDGQDALLMTNESDESLILSDNQESEVLKNEKSVKTKKDKSDSAQLIANVITILDAIVLQNKDFSLAKAPSRTEEVLKIVTPVTEKILKTYLKGLERSNPAYDTVVALSSDPNKIRATAAVIIDAVHYIAFKEYQMFVKRYNQKEKTKVEYKNLYAKNPKGFIDQIIKEQDNKKYAVQILVDGLEGHLVESLAKGNFENPFFKKLQEDRLNYIKYKPHGIPFRELDPIQEDFLNYAIKQKSYNHPAYMSFFKELYRTQSNGLVKTGNTTTPTISARNMPIISTGAPVEGTGATHLVNMHFINRSKDRAYYFFSNDLLVQQDLTKEAGMKTPAERLEKKNTLNCMSQLEAGYDWVIDPLITFAISETTRDYGDTLCMNELKRRTKNQALYTKLTNRLKNLFIVEIKKRYVKKN